MLTRQELFTKVADHLIAQNAKSLNARGCAYRGFNGMKCAAGVLISDEHYHLGLEGYQSNFSFARQALELSGVNTRRDMDLIIELQTIHDMNDPDSWNNKLRALAQRYGLSYAE